MHIDLPTIAELSEILSGHNTISHLMTRRPTDLNPSYAQLTPYRYSKTNKNLNQLLLDFYDGKALPIIKTEFSAFNAAKYYQSSS